MIDILTKYVLRQNSSFISLYVYPEFKRRNINLDKIIKKLTELYGDYFSPDQFFEFGEKYLNDYLIEKRGISFGDLLTKSLKSIINRYGHFRRDAERMEKKYRCLIDKS